jgi:tetratricopeptide (TPR) repeat protein
VRQDRTDADAYAGLGDAELQQGDFRSARRAFATALTLRPGDERIASRLDLCDRALALDPTQRGVAASEQYRRSGALLELTVAAVDSCTRTALVTPQSSLLDSARDALAWPVPAASSQDAAAEARANLAERIWQYRPPACPVPPWAKPAELVLTKLGD